MSRLKMAAVAAALAFAPLSPALAQDAAPVTAEPQMTPADQAFQTQGTAFEQESQALMSGLQTIMGDATLDKATKTARTNALIDEYTPKFEAFAGVLKAYLVELAGRPERAEQSAEILAASETVPAQLLTVPGMLREGIERDLAAQP